MTRTRIKNKYNKWPSRENFLALKQIKSKYTNLTKTAKKQYFVKSTENQYLTNKSFWNSISSFLTSKNVRNDDVLKEKGRLINDELEVAKTLNLHQGAYIYYVEGGGGGGGPEGFTNFSKKSSYPS